MKVSVVRVDRDGVRSLGSANFDGRSVSDFRDEHGEPWELPAGSRFEVSVEQLARFPQEGRRSLDVGPDA